MCIIIFYSLFRSKLLLFRLRSHKNENYQNLRLRLISVMLLIKKCYTSTVCNTCYIQKRQLFQCCNMNNFNIFVSFLQGSISGIRLKVSKFMSYINFYRFCSQISVLIVFILRHIKQRYTCLVLLCVKNRRTKNKILIITC